MENNHQSLLITWLYHGLFEGQGHTLFQECDSDGIHVDSRVLKFIFWH